jgi:hypothetical protein
MKAITLRMAAALYDLSAERAALLLTIGLLAGIFPIYGCATILCISASFALRLNFPALQLVNQISWPLQIATLIPLARLGSRIVAPSGGFAVTLAGRLGATALEALVGWLCVCVPLGILLYLALTGLLRSGALEWFRPPMPKIANEGSPIC